MLSRDLLSETASEQLALLNSLRQGNREAWQTLVATFRKRLRDLAASALPLEVGGRTDASDVVQQTLVEANQSFVTFNGTTLRELFAWLTAILNHNVDDAIRHHVLAQRRTVRAECHLDDVVVVSTGWDYAHPDQTSPSKAAARGEVWDRLYIALASLPPRQREAVLLRHLKGRPLSDIAAELDCSLQAAAALIARGLRALRGALQDLD